MYQRYSRYKTVEKSSLCAGIPHQKLFAHLFLNSLAQRVQREWFSSRTLFICSWILPTMSFPVQTLHLYMSVLVTCMLYDNNTNIFIHSRRLTHILVYRAFIYCRTSIIIRYCTSWNTQDHPISQVQTNVLAHTWTTLSLTANMYLPRHQHSNFAIVGQVTAFYYATWRTMLAHPLMQI